MSKKRRTLIALLSIFIYLGAIVLPWYLFLALVATAIAYRNAWELIGAAVIADMLYLSSNSPIPFLMTLIVTGMLTLAYYIRPRLLLYR